MLETCSSSVEQNNKNTDASKYKIKNSTTTFGSSSCAFHLQYLVSFCLCISYLCELGTIHTVVKVCKWRWVGHTLKRWHRQKNFHWSPHNTPPKTRTTWSRTIEIMIRDADWSGQKLRTSLKTELFVSYLLLPCVIPRTK